MSLTKSCTEAPFCAKKTLKKLLFGPDCAKVASRKSAKTAQFVCFHRHFMTFWFWSRNAPFVCHAAAIMVVLFAIRMAKLSRLAGGTSPEGAERVSRPQEHNTGRIYGQNESGKGENHSCAWETPPALRATSPTRRRSFASGGTNSLLRRASYKTDSFIGKESKEQ